RGAGLHGVGNRYRYLLLSCPTSRAGLLPDGRKITDRKVIPFLKLPMSPQHTIAHYRILSKLGEGGMGEVWRATDTKLNRGVAIKVLTDSFAADPDRMARFQREAQVLALLNHPNIAAIYGVEERALVMELIEGAPLKGPYPLSQAMTYACQILDALDVAHRKG